MTKNIFLNPAIELIHTIVRLDNNEFIDWYTDIIDTKGGIKRLDKFLISHCHKMEEQLENLDNITNMLKLFKYRHIPPKYLLINRMKTIIDIKRQVVYELTSKYL
jgi:hypothetical protein